MSEIHHPHHLPGLGNRPGFEERIAQLSSTLDRSRAVYRWLSVVGIAGLSGLGIGLAMPRGPVTSGQALALLIVSLLVGFVSGWVLGSRWAMLLAPVAQIIVFELTRLGASGPTVDGISFDGTFGPLAFVVGRGFYGLVGTFPMVVAAAYGAALGRRSAVHSERRLHSRIEFTPAALRADLEGQRLVPRYLYSAAELVDHAADLLAQGAVLVHESERRWRVFSERVETLRASTGEATEGAYATRPPYDRKESA